MVTIIHNTYDQNMYVRESAELNIKSLQDSGIDYQYIIYNDHGDPSIIEDIRHLLNNKVEYIYSNINYGMGVCSGGWIGAIPYIKGDCIHNIGQDDIFSSLFYIKSLELLNDSDIYLVYSNGFVVNENLTFANQLMGPLHNMDYSNPKHVFDQWFQRRGDVLTAANNYIPAPGVIYKTILHELIEPPNLVEFKGSADFEYWARILFNGFGIKYNPNPNWFYRMSRYSYGQKSTATTDIWNKNILNKYQKCIMQ